MLSPGGRSLTFDMSADGYGRGEGAGFRGACDEFTVGAVLEPADIVGGGHNITSLPLCELKLS